MGTKGEAMSNTALAKPVDWDELYPNRFLKAGELRGKKVTLTIESVELDELESDQGKKIKGVLSFRETKKQIALNKTNGICIKAMFGRKLADWSGKRVTWFAGAWNGEEAIRVWGSPDITVDTDIVVQLPRKKPTKMTMHAGIPAKGPKAAADPHGDPEPDFAQRGEEEGRS